MSEPILFGDELFAPPTPAEVSSDNRETFAQAGAKLTRLELVFVKGILSGLKPIEAARKAWPAMKSGTAAELQKKPLIARAIELGRRELAVDVQREAKYSVVEAIAEIDEKIRAATIRGNDGAIASLLSLKARLSGLLVERSDAQQAGFQIVVQGVDPMKMANVVEGEIVKEGE